jgi:hypothetical protein
VAGQIETESRSQKVAYYVIAYAVWLAASAMAAVVGAYWHFAGINLYLGLRLNRWAFNMFGTWLALGLVLVWLGLVVYLEHWFSHAGTLARLRRRVAWFLIPELVVLAVSYLAATFLVTRYV